MARLLCGRRQARLLSRVGDRRVYFVHSFRATPSPENADWVLATSHYGGDFISAVQKGEVNATQFHPEKSGAAGLDIIQSFLEPPREHIVPSANGEAWPSTCSALSRMILSFQELEGGLLWGWEKHDHRQCHSFVKLFIGISTPVLPKALPAANTATFV